MENVLTIISEFNPFHYGHLYHLGESIKAINPEYKAAIISGNFVQRGEPSLLNKWEKTRIALHYGFDLIVELPTIYAISSAENFASGAIKVAKQLATTHLSFGTECGNIELLEELSSLIDDSPEYVENLKDKLARGYSYPKSQEMAIKELFPSKFKGICMPNNILGIEYLRSIKIQEASIKPVTIERNAKFASATEIRELIRESKNLDKHLPAFSLDVFEENKNNGNVAYSLKSFEKEIIYTIRKMDIEELKDYPDISDNLFKKIKTSAQNCNTIDELISRIKNKSITQARIQRILLYVLLNIKKSDMEMSKCEIPYVRILGISQKGKKLLSKISYKNTNVITTVKGYEQRCQNSNLYRMLQIDKFATDVHTMAYLRNSVCNLDYTTRMLEYEFHLRDF